MKPVHVLACVLAACSLAFPVFAQASDRPAMKPDGQGIQGQVVRLTGDFMPGSGHRGTSTPLAVPVHVFKGSLKPITKPDPKHPALVKIVRAGKDGRFKLALMPGVYTIVAEIDGKLYLNSYQGSGEWGSVKVKAGKWTDVSIEDTSGAAF